MCYLRVEHYKIIKREWETPFAYRHFPQGKKFKKVLQLQNIAFYKFNIMIRISSFFP